MRELIEIDGSMGEGGGQILRYSAALSALTLKPLRIYNIRAKRDNPGLRPQHLAAIKAIAELSDAQLEGARVGSTEITFVPRRRVSGDLKIDIGTAGSVSLLIQAILPVLLFGESDSRVTIRGGTNVAWSPPIDYMKHVFLHNLAKLGVSADISVLRRGHYPRGGGEVILTVRRAREALRPINVVKRGKLLGLSVISYCVKLPKHVAERQAKAALDILERVLPVKKDVEVEWYPPEKDPHLDPGSGILVYVDAEPGVRLGADALGERGKPAEKVGAEAADKLLRNVETGMAFDEHMADMIIPYLFLADGASEIGVAKLTSHAVTAIEIAKLFFPEASVRVEGEEGKPAIIAVRGVGFSR